MSNNNLHSWAEIPAEVLISILQRIEEKQTVLECQLVCKAWKKSAERVGYHTIALSEYHPQLTKLVETLQSTPHLGKLVYRFHFNKVFLTTDGPWDPKNHFKKLGDYCPNVQAMTTMYSCHSLWLRLIMDQHIWKNLSIIPEPDSNSDVQLYTATALAYSDRLTNLLILQDSEDSLQVRRERDKLLSNLSKFKCLTHLKLFKEKHVKPYELDSIINDCPNLTSLIVRLTFPKSTDNPIVFATNRSSQVLDEIKLLEPKTNIKKLFLEEADNGGDETLCYIMHAFPNLSYIYFNRSIGFVAEEPTLITYSLNTLKSFLQYTLSIPNVTLKYLYCEDIVAVLSDYWQSEAYKATKKEPCLEIVGNGYSGDRSHRPYINVLGRKIQTTYSKLDDDASPVDLIEKIGRLVVNLKVDVSGINVVLLDKDLANMYQGFFLDRIFEYCTSLKELECSFNILQSCDPELHMNGTIEKLVLNNSPINSNVLYQLSIRLPGLRTLVLSKNTFIKYNGVPIKGKRIVINMPYTRFKSLIIEETPRKQHDELFVKYSTPLGDRFLSAQLEDNFTVLKKCSVNEYEVKLSNKKCYFIDIRCEMLSHLSFKFGEKLIVFHNNK